MTLLNIFTKFFKKVTIDISCESSAWLTFHMKCQYLFSIKSKIKIEYRLPQMFLVMI